MPHKRRKTSDVSTKGDVYKERSILSAPERKEDERREDVFFPEFSQVPVQENNSDIVRQNINGDGDWAPTVRYLPNFHSFVTIRTSNPIVRTRLNFPKLVIPSRLMQPEEDSIMDLRALLKNIGFDVVDRKTLAFFAIGSELDIRKAAMHFVNLHNLSSTVEFKSPSREILQSMETDALIEGVALHRNGTFGPLYNLEKWNINFTAPYVAREVLCYILSMVDLSLLREGITMVFNARKLSWKVFHPFEVIKLGKIMNGCVPLRVRGRFVIDPCYYGALARRVLQSMRRDEAGKVTFFLSVDEVRLRYPHLVLPESITGFSNNKLIKHLSIDEQLKMSFF